MAKLHVPIYLIEIYCSCSTKCTILATLNGLKDPVAVAQWVKHLPLFPYTPQFISSLYQPLTLLRFFIAKIYMKLMSIYFMVVEFEPTTFGTESPA